MFKPYIYKSTLSLALLLSSLLGIAATALPSQAQREGADLSSALLEDANCVTSVSRSAGRPMYVRKELVPINRQVFEQQFSLHSYHDGNRVTLTCKIDNERYDILDLEMGVSDNSEEHNAEMTVNVYQGGIVIHTYANMQAGSMANVILDLNTDEIPSDPSNIAVEVICHNSVNYDPTCDLHVVTARLYPTDQYSSQDSSSRKPEPGASRSDSLEEVDNTIERGADILDEVSDTVTRTSNILEDVDGAVETLQNIFD
ncbi:MAG: hypothetical protein F6J87_15805 [Spirulina sp. SIO3F2]|nr:hypothetical protein [Spirulina sp. SIO3F2]